MNTATSLNGSLATKQIPQRKPTLPESVAGNISVRAKNPFVRYKAEGLPDPEEGLAHGTA